MNRKDQLEEKKFCCPRSAVEGLAALSKGGIIASGSEGKGIAGKRRKKERLLFSDDCWEKGNKVCVPTSKGGKRKVYHCSSAAEEGGAESR